MSTSPVFIVGAPRSGTSLLRDLLRSHPNIAIDHESHFVPGFYRAFGDPRTDRQARRLARRILATGWVGRWRVDLDPDSLAHHRSYAKLVATIFARMAEQRYGKPRWGDKTPQYLAETPTLLELFPEARILHIYRDGRDVARSAVAAAFGPANLYTAATRWRDAVSRGRLALAGLPRSSYAELSFERLLADPERAMREVCEFLAEPFDPAVLSPTYLPRTSFRTFVGRRRMSRRDRPEGIITGSAGRWKDELTADEITLCESVAGETLRELGYPTETEGDASPSRARALAWELESAASRAVTRLSRRPAWPRTAAITLGVRLRERLRAR